jgi:hypothetical protein
LVFEFLYRLITLGKGYFEKFDEEAVKNNFVLVYELLDGECATVEEAYVADEFQQRSWTSGIPRTQMWMS